MTRKSIEELINAWRTRYQANRKEKTKILDEFVALTRYHRKAAIHTLKSTLHHQKSRRNGIVASRKKCTRNGRFTPWNILPRTYSMR